MSAISRTGNIFEDVAIKAPVRLAATGNIVLSGEQPVDGIAALEGDRVLAPVQTDPTQNGIWQVSTGPWQRTADARGNTDFIDGTLVPVARGDSNSGQLFQLLCTDSPVEIGTSQLVFQRQDDVINGRQIATSATSVAIGIGPRTFGIQDGKDFETDQFVLIYQTSSPGNAMLAQILSLDGGTLSVTSIADSGSGSHSDWTIVLANSANAAGRMPPIGTGNMQGSGTSTEGHFAVYAGPSGRIITDSGHPAGVLARRDQLLYGDAGDASIPQRALVPGAAPLPYCAAQPNDNLRLVNDLSNPNRDINITAGRCRDNADTTNLHLAATMLKRLDQAWAAGGAAGAAAGSCDTGTKGASQCWHLFLIAKQSLAVLQASRLSNVATLSIASVGAGVGGTVRTYGLGQGLDAIAPVTAVGANSVLYANTGPDISTFTVSGLADLYDVLASQSYGGPALPAGWTTKQCLGSVLTDGSGNIRAFVQNGDVFNYVAPVTDVNAIASTAARVATALTVPLGVAVRALFRAGLNIGAGASAATIFTALTENDQAPVFGAIADLSNVTNTFACGAFERLTNTSAQIGVRSVNTVAAVTISTTGWRDPRRRLF